MTPLTPEDRKAANELANGIIAGTIALSQTDDSRAAIELARALLDANAEIRRLRLEVPACAAIRNRDGITIAGAYHGECIAMTPQMCLVGIEWKKGSVQGFMTTRGRFVDRKEAMALMLAAGRTSANKEAHHGGWSLPGGELASEDLLLI